MKPIREIRRLNLVALIAEFGGQKALADQIQKDKNQVYQWSLAPEREASRNISDSTARAIEAATGRPKGWMDHEHDDGEEAGAGASQPVGLSPAKIATTTEALLIFMRRRDPRAALDLTKLADAQLFAEAYALDSSNELAFGAAVADLLQTRGLSRGRESGKDGGDSRGEARKAVSS